MDSITWIFCVVYMTRVYRVFLQELTVMQLPQNRLPIPNSMTPQYFRNVYETKIIFGGLPHSHAWCAGANQHKPITFALHSHAL